MTEPFHRDLFHCAALTAWVQIAVETGQRPPDSELTKRRAYELYERELARKSRQKSGN
jgi:hypothetical protein